MSSMRRLSGLALALMMMAGLTQCKKTDSGSSAAASSGGAAAGGAPQISPDEQAAREAVLAEIGKQWKKTPDGWVTAKTFGVSFSPDHFLREIKEITVSGVEAADLSDADRANGFEWAGQVSFKGAPCREAGDPGILLDGMGSQRPNRRRGAWTQWVDFQPGPMRVQKQKGKWQVEQDTWFLRSGAIPTDADFAHAGVK